MVVDGYSVPARNTEYDYLDVFFSSALGTLAVPGTAITLSGGQSATVTGTLTAAAPAAAGRQLFGEMTVVAGWRGSRNRVGARLRPLISPPEKAATLTGSPPSPVHASAAARHVDAPYTGWAIVVRQ